MIGYSNEFVDLNFLFCLQYYDYAEMALLDRNLSKGDTFVNIGSHIYFWLPQING